MDEEAAAAGAHFSRLWLAVLLYSFCIATVAGNALVILAVVQVLFRLVNFIKKKFPRSHNRYRRMNLENQCQLTRNTQWKSVFVTCSMKM